MPQRVPPPSARGRPYTQHRPETSPLYRVVADHFATLEPVHEERFEPRQGPRRAAARRAAGRFFDCGLPEHGSVRVRCGTCRAEFLVEYRCTGRQFCPSCHAPGSGEGSVWLGEHPLAPVAHRQAVRTVPKRLRGYLNLLDRLRQGLVSRLATRTLPGQVQAAVGEREGVPGLIECVPTFGSVAPVHLHLNVRMTGGAFRRGGDAGRGGGGGCSRRRWSAVRGSRLRSGLRSHFGLTPTTARGAHWRPRA